MIQVIYDCDNTMGLPFKEVDDGLTLLYLLGRPDIELIGVTTTFGNGTAQQSYDQTRKLLAQAGRPGIPVLLGADRRFAPPTEAASFLAETAAAHPGDIDILATGPLGNLRGAAELDPQFFSHVHQIACMGGYTAPLRIGKKNIAELNLSVDPEASYQAFNADCPLTLMNAHVCLQAPLNKAEIAAFTFWPPRMRRILRWWLFAFGTFCGVSEFYLWDLLPAVYLSYPDLFAQQRVHIHSSVQDLENGSLIVEDGGDERLINMPDRILDVEKFKAVIFDAWKSVNL